MTDLFRFVSEDAKGTGVKLEDLVAFSEKVNDWQVILNNEGDNIIGYYREIFYAGDKYRFEILKPGSEFTLMYSDSSGVLCHFEGAEIEKLYGKIQATTQKRLDENYQVRARDGKNALEYHIG